MSHDLDRFDRMLVSTQGELSLTTRPVVVDRMPVITSARGPRFVDHMTCPLCGTDRLGIEYHGELMSGAKVHTIAAHTAGLRRVERKQPRCLGATMRVEFVGGVWRGVQQP